VKRNALRCLTVIFRDLLNYSRTSLNMILKPAWKLLNQSLPIYTEVVGYQAKQQESEDEEQQEIHELWDDDETDVNLDSDSVYGMIFSSLELLATLV